ncbi:uncharacterized protein LOC105395465 [Plutella xylostella]|uniref:uncharacterized protein LOC105395465 n=1 Tax=Plutella xylostella TaxID=51655 RepID=UPI00203299A5|nr:uncharacterized protein LOC105395465 [Plutella xylostella]
MARQSQTILLVLLVALPVLASVITAFRVRDLPKLDVKHKQEKCDDCDGVSEIKIQKQNVKLEPPRRSYEEMKKAAREKQQTLKKTDSTPVFSLKDEDSDDEDYLPQESLKSKQTDKKVLSNSKEDQIQLKSKTVKTAFTGGKSKVFSVEDDSDDDDDDDDNDGKTYKSTSTVTKDKKISKTVSKKQSNENDDDETDEDDDDDDDNNIKSKSSKHSSSEKKVTLKDSKIESQTKVHGTADDDDDDDSDDDDIKNSKSTVSPSKFSVKNDNAQKSAMKPNLKLIQNAYDNDDDDDDDDESDDDSEKSTKPKELASTSILKQKTVSKTKISDKHLKDNDSDDDGDDDDDKKVVGTKKDASNSKSLKKSDTSTDKKLKPVISIKTSLFDDDDSDDDDEDEDVSTKTPSNVVHEPPSQLSKKENVLKSSTQKKDEDDSDSDDDDSDSTIQKPPLKVIQEKTTPQEVKPKPTLKHEKDDQKASNVKSDVKSSDKIQKKDTIDSDAKDKKSKDTKVKEQHDVKTEAPKKLEQPKKDAKSEKKIITQEESSKKKTSDQPPERTEKHTKIVEEKKEIPKKVPETPKPKEPIKETVKSKTVHDSKEDKNNKEHQIKKTERKPLPDAKKSHEPESWEPPDSVEELHILKDSREKKDDAKDIFAFKASPDKHASDAVTRRNLLQSDFEDFYALLPTFAPNFSRIHNPECRRHGQILLRQLRGTKLWALNMLDATAKVPSGLLQGNGIQLGDFDQCLGSRARVQLDTGSVVKVQGQYCLVQVDVKAEHPELELPVHLAQARNLIKSRIDDPGHFVPRYSTLSWGVCVPAACEPQDVEVMMKDTLKHYQHTSGFVVKVKVEDDDCHVDDADWMDEWLELPTLLTLLFYGVIVLMVFIATIQDFFARRKSSEEETPAEGADDKAECDQKEVEEEEKEKEETETKPTSGEGILSSFSLYSTLGKLTAPGAADDIACIHGVRAAATVSLLVAHKFLAVGVMPYTNRVKMAEDASSPLFSWFRAGWVYTDCFLLLSGTLLANRVAVDPESSAPRRLLSRYLRLTPALLAVVLFYAYIWDHISWGPRWGTLVTRNAELCQESWWWNILYVQNYFGMEEMCAPQTHQLALDMQLTIAGGVLLWIMQVKPRASWLLLPALHAAAAYSRYTTVYEHRLTMLAYHGVSISQLYRTARLSYISAFHRCTPYLVGLSLGLRLQEPRQHNMLVQILGWLASISLWALIWWSGMDSGSSQYRYSPAVAAQYAALAPVAAALALAWVIYIVHHGHCEWLANLFCSRPLVFISRISYALYLIQFIIFFTNAAVIRTPSEFTLMSLIDAQEIIMLLIASIVLTLTFVTPMQSLHKIFKFSSKTEEDEPTEETGEKESKDNEEQKDTEAEPEVENTGEVEEIEEIVETPSRIKQNFMAHRELLEEIPESEVEYELQRDRIEVLEEILEEEEYDVEEGVEEEEMERDVEDGEVEDGDVAEEELEVIEEEQEQEEQEEGGEDDFWADREDDYVARRSYSPNDDDELQEWELTQNNSQAGNGTQYYRYGR